MNWKDVIDPVMDKDELHKFVNSDGVTINSNIREIKTSFRYLGIATNHKKLERLLKLIDPSFIDESRRSSRTEIEYEKKVFLKFKELTKKTNPQEYLANYAKSKKELHLLSNLTKEQFMSIMKSNTHNIISWDVKVGTIWPRYVIKAEVFKIL